jgi:Taurine catabolism dioxygenase TauD, TfdA family
MTTTAQRSLAAAEPPMPLRPIEGPFAWRGSALARSNDYIHRFTAAELGEIDGAIETARRHGTGLLELRPDTFPLPKLGPFLTQLRDGTLLQGRGFAMLRGLPVERYSMEESAIAYLGLGSYFGTAVSQNAKGHALGHVKDLGRTIDDPTARIYQTTHKQTFHTDSVDIVALLCLKTARAGGLSRIVSSVHLYNEMFRRRPDLAAELFHPFAFDRRGEVPPGKKPYFTIPIFHWHHGQLTVFYGNRYYIQSAQRFAEVPRLTARQSEALDLFDALANDPDNYLDIEFKPGDIQLVHNHVILHDRTDYEDWPEPERRRHLLRLWLCPPNGRPLPTVLADRYGSVEIGRRGGIMVEGTRLTAPLEAC